MLCVVHVMVGFDYAIMLCYAILYYGVFCYVLFCSVCYAMPAMRACRLTWMCACMYAFVVVPVLSSQENHVAPTNLDIFRWVVTVIEAL